MRPRLHRHIDVCQYRRVSNSRVDPDAGRGGRLLLPAEPRAAEPRQAERVAPMLKALADPVRLRLLSLVASHEGGEACVCDLNDAFELSQPTISHHLKVLHEAGLLDREKRGVWVYYRSSPRPSPRSATLIAGVARRDGCARRAPAEFVGTAFLVAAVIGSGIAASRLSPHDVGLQLLENSRRHRRRAGRADPGPAAGVGRVQPRRHRSSSASSARITTRDAVALIAAQVAGGVVGAVVANLMFDLPAVSVSAHAPLRQRAVARRGGRDARAGRSSSSAPCAAPAASRVAFAVGGYITARLLVHQLHQLRQPRRHLRPHVLRHLRRHRTRVGPGVRPDPARRRRDSDSASSRCCTPTPRHRPQHHRSKARP